MNKNLSKSAMAQLWFGFAILVSATLVAFTFLFPLLSSQIPRDIEQALSSLNLRRENNLAAWWSGVLLLLSAMHCGDGWAQNRQINPVVAKSWLALTCVLTILSCDEIASIHERVGDYGWLALLPPALILLGMVSYAVYGLWSDPDHRATVRWILLAFTLFGSVAIQERIEHLFDWSAFGEAVRGSLEEGTELAGMLILLRVSMTNSISVFSTIGVTRIRVFELAVEIRRYLIAVGILAAPFLTYITPRLSPSRGQLADWFATSLFFLAALATLHYSVAQRSRRDWWTVAAFCLASMVMAVPIRLSINILGMEASVRALVYWAALSVSLVIWQNGRLRTAERLLGFMLGTAVYFAVYAMASGSPTLSYLFPAYLALAAYAAASSTAGGKALAPRVLPA